MHEKSFRYLSISRCISDIMLWNVAAAKMQFHRNPYLQRGSGIGSIFSGLFRAAVPVLSSVGKSLFGSDAAKAVGKSIADTALRSGLSLAGDALSGQNVGDAFKKHLGVARQEVAQAVRAGVGRPQQSITAAATGKKKRKKPSRPPAKSKTKKKKKGRKPVSVFSNDDEEDDEDEDDEDD
jgi:hypothetical protein